MKELPKELTTELMNLVIGETTKGDFEISNNKLYSMGSYVENLDTLTRLMKEWCFNEGLMFDIRWHTNRNPKRISAMTYGKGSTFFTGNTEFETVLSMTSWLAKDKGE
jgi:hypothetical protein